MPRRFRVLLGLALLAALLSGPLTAVPPQEAVGLAAGETDERARAVPGLAEERDRQRGARATRAPGPRGPALEPAAPVGDGPVYASKFGLAVADVTVGDGATLEKAEQAGAGWMMGWVSWRNVEPARGAFAWESGAVNDLDNVARAGAAYGLRVLVHLHDVPSWATADGSGRLSQVRPDDLRASLEAIARYGAGRVLAYEVFNEPNLNYEWGADVDAEAAAGYARLLRAAYAGLKAGDPSTFVVAAGLANGACCGSLDDLAYLRAFYAAGAKGSFDALGTHPYGGNTPPESTSCGGTCFRRAELHREIMLDHGDGATPLWATEVGWLLESDDDLGPYFNWQKVSAEQQADYTVGAFRYAEQHWPWMGPMFVFNLDHSTARWCDGLCYPPSTSVYWYSVLNPDRSPRPVYTALSHMVTGGSPPKPSATPTATGTPGSPTATPSPTAARPAPLAPSGLRAAAKPGQIKLKWKASRTKRVTYSVYRGPAPGQVGERIASGLGKPRFDDRDLTRGQVYYYRVAARTADGESASSNEASAQAR